MSPTWNRRSFIKGAALAAAAPLWSTAQGRENVKPADQLRCAQIGCGERSKTHLEQVIFRRGQKLVAMVDPDENTHARVKSYLQGKNISTAGLRAFTDYRTMFDKMAGEIDAVFVATPNHHHALVSMMAMERGINVYCEKPVCHDIAEARQMREAARRYPNVATQMGNQGHAMDGYRSLCEYIWAGVIGPVRETHSWTNRANGGIGPRPPSLPVPHGLHWDTWIGPAPSRPYSSDLHPHEWHGWYDFGNGSLGNMGCHVLDGVFWALKIGHPTSVEAEMIRGGSDERYPIGCRLRWDVPMREEMPALKAYWYEGLNPTAPMQFSSSNHAAQGASRNLPSLLQELKKKYPEEDIDNGDSGSIYVGDKGMIYTSTYGKEMHVIPIEKMDEIPVPHRTLPRPKEIFADFLDACRSTNKQTAVPFEYGTRLTEFALLGNLAQHAGINRKVEWDGPGMRVTNIPELNHWVKCPQRKGWET